MPSPEFHTVLSDGETRTECPEVSSLRKTVLKKARETSPSTCKIMRYLRRKMGSSLKARRRICRLKSLTPVLARLKYRVKKIKAECDQARRQDIKNEVTVSQLENAYNCVTAETRPAPSSMSKRRIASKRPALDCVVEIPPSSGFMSVYFQDPTGQKAFPALAALSGDTNTPITPLDQIIAGTPQDPPTLCRTGMRTFKPKPKLSILTTIRPAHFSLARKGIDPLDELDSPYIPFTPLESPSSCFPSPTLEVSNRLSKLDISPFVRDKSASPTVAPPSQTTTSNTGVNGTPRKLPFSLPRRLSYKLAIPSMSSPLTPNTANSLMQPTEGNDLASPLALRASMPSVYRPVVPGSRTPNGSKPRSPASYF
ncbi:hypothetical protein BXZ70DRAFT_926831 [Cristinia sonorae]|uniref:Uncharacterized protein n=1 Tax=Cristinia sonorae TaxID=1940300 RepID=A0A8K0URR5_9AGAR|nr:hypothetical protein BXZ70DRAFT_926831 [Cristinia sonorae]